MNPLKPLATSQRYQGEASPPSPTEQNAPVETRQTTGILSASSSRKESFGNSHTIEMASSIPQIKSPQTTDITPTKDNNLSNFVITEATAKLVDDGLTITPMVGGKVINESSVKDDIHLNAQSVAHDIFKHVNNSV